MSAKISVGQRRILYLTQKDKKEDGWTPVSATVWPLLDDISKELLEREQFPDGSGRARLTKTGEIVLQWT
jgi:hypothetical protein